MEKYNEIETHKIIIDESKGSENTIFLKSAEEKESTGTNFQINETPTNPAIPGKKLTKPTGAVTLPPGQVFAKEDETGNLIYQKSENPFASIKKPIHALQDKNDSFTSRKPTAQENIITEKRQIIRRIKNVFYGEKNERKRMARTNPETPESRYGTDEIITEKIIMENNKK